MFSVFIIEKITRKTFKGIEIYGFDKEYEFGFINGDLKIVDVDLDGDNDIVSMENCFGSPTGGIVYNSYVRSTTNYFDSWNFSLENSSIEVNKFKTRLLMV
jgi:hypothetical protein